MVTAGQGSILAGQADGGRWAQSPVTVLTTTETEAGHCMEPDASRRGDPLCSVTGGPVNTVSFARLGRGLDSVQSPSPSSVC